MSNDPTPVLASLSWETMPTYKGAIWLASEKTRVLEVHLKSDIDALRAREEQEVEVLRKLLGEAVAELWATYGDSPRTMPLILKIGKALKRPEAPHVD